MRKLYLLCSLLFIFCFYQQGYTQHAKELSPGYYVVVAAFSPDREHLAKSYTTGLTNRDIKADYGFNSERNYFYVFVNYFPQRKPSLDEMMETRKKEEFAKAWVRKVSPYNSAKITTVIQEVKNDVPEKIEEPVRESVGELVTPVTQISSKDTVSAMVTEDTAKVELKDILADTVVEVALDNTEIFLSLTNATNNRIVEGKVKVVDTQKAKLLMETPGNDFLTITDLKTTTQLTLICEAFGYRKVQQEITYPMLLADTVKQNIEYMGTAFIVYFDLVRYNKGDIATLYQVFFYNDAAVMLPESKFELNSLLQMMQENPQYRIRLHGHTNGNYHGKIVLMGTEKNFFSLDGSKKTTGSAKDLSEARASIIKDYLVANGIEGSRIEVKAWGGKRPIYDKHSANAKKNVRVEVEILEEK
jgi:outer membrane protein OmpA-like peptidoglycan-associated protein